MSVHNSDEVDNCEIDDKDSENDDVQSHGATKA